ncbi:MAG: YdcH family protein [Brevundimonas sp.]|uniref:YdcH family protein n=1 Tax=Brevundimonas sp. TaxID=1871086 RepID=UPI001A1E4BE4|nr:YdcH family protein [Brevundimonas sp.]MBJ7447226.1 YdcH family protein [Brevundimonas sp.]
MSIVMKRRLRGFHALLDMALRDERSRPRPSDFLVADIKKKKLSIKDQLVSLDRRTHATAR